MEPPPGEVDEVGEGAADIHADDRRMAVR
jgi:hypothetical protein